MKKKIMFGAVLAVLMGLLVSGCTINATTILGDWVTDPVEVTGILGKSKVIYGMSFVNGSKGNEFTQTIGESTVSTTKGDDFSWAIQGEQLIITKVSGNTTTTKQGVLTKDTITYNGRTYRKR